MQTDDNIYVNRDDMGHLATIGDTSYATDRRGVIQQLYPEPFKYDAAYVAKYAGLKYSETAGALSRLRWQWILAHCRLNPDTVDNVMASVLDFGCGTGDFLKEAMADAKRRGYRLEAAGYDISGYAVDGFPVLTGSGPEDYDGVAKMLGGVCQDIRDPEGPVDPWDIVTFYDSLEHVPDFMRVLRMINARHVVISLPWCHANTLGVEWFTGWKHRKPGEHLWHFDAASLCGVMGSLGWRAVTVGNPEDRIRKPAAPAIGGGYGGVPNILTGIFERMII